jgi:hypothetical protein
MIDSNADHQRLQMASVVISIAYYRANTLFKIAHPGDNKITYVMSLCRIGRVTKFTRIIFARSEDDGCFKPKE